MKFTSKISGTMVTEFEIKPLFTGQVIPLKELDEKLSERAMRWVMDNFYLSRMTDKGYELYGCRYCTTLDYDTIYKLTVLEKYPDYVAEFVEYFGEKWLNHYIRFGH